MTWLLCLHCPGSMAWRGLIFMTSTPLLVRYGEAQCTQILLTASHNINKQHERMMKSSVIRQFSHTLTMLGAGLLFHFAPEGQCKQLLEQTLLMYFGCRASCISKDQKEVAAAPSINLMPISTRTLTISMHLTVS